MAIAAVLAFAVVPAVAQGPSEQVQITDADGDVFVVDLPYTVDTVAPTVPPTTTTSTAPPTTTTPPAPELPPTQPYDTTQLSDNGGFQFVFNCTEKFGDDCLGHSNIATNIYIGHGNPYLYSYAEPGHHDHGWWVDGDRQGYGCAYAFLYDVHPNPFGGEISHPDAELINRAAVVAPDGAAYGQIIDKYMEEGIRFLDGTIVNPSQGQEIQTEDCSEVRDDFDYASYVPHGADDIRIGLYTPEGELSDIRDFTALDLADRAAFEFLSFDGERATVLLVLEDLGVSHVFYYDVMNGGQIVVEVNGQIVPPT